MLIVKLKRLIFYTVVRFVWFLKVRPVSKSQSYCYLSSEILTMFLISCQNLALLGVNPVGIFF